MSYQILLTDGEETIKVLENAVGIETFSVVGGATLDRGSVITGTSAVLDGFAICTRFKLKVLGAQGLFSTDIFSHKDLHVF